jgi:hypothetical protein
LYNINAGIQKIAYLKKTNKYPEAWLSKTGPVCGSRYSGLFKTIIASNFTITLVIDNMA